jgi:predicted Zn-dependent peptidase
LEFHSHTLKNGLEVVAECNAEAHSAALGFFVKTGSRDETDDVRGVSHFLEHMMFKGTPTRSADDVNREFDEMGAHYNAFTNEENTVYYAAVLPECLDRALRLLADILRPSLREEDFNTEKQVILEEISMYEDQPPFRADERCKTAYYGPHPLGNSILGTVESVTELSVGAMRDYFRRRYSPAGVVLAAAGRIDFDAFCASAEQCCGAWEPSENSRSVDRVAPRQGFEVFRKETATQQYVLQLSAGPAADDPGRYAAKLLATVLGDDSGSRLYWELIDPGLAEHVSLSHCENEGAGLMMTYMSCDPELAAENLRRILDVYRRAEAGGVTPAELDQAKSKIRSRIVLSSERPRGRLFTVGGDWVYRREYRSVRDDLEEVASITPEQIAAVLSEYPLTRNTTVTIGPLGEVSAPK